MGISNKQENKQLVSDLATVLVSNELTELEFQQGDTYIKLSKGGNVVTQVMAAAPQAIAPSVNVAPAMPSVSDKAAVEANPADNPKAIKSPMVGVAYLTPGPNSPNYVKVGDTVDVGQTLLLVEAMKTFNPVKAPRAGKVTAILVTNGAPVEFDEPLLIIE